MNASLAQKAFVGVAVLLAALSVVVALSNLRAADESWVVQNFGRVRAMAMAVTPAALIALGLGLSLRFASFGGILALIGAAAFAVMMLWTIFIPLLAGLAVLLWLIALRSTKALEGRNEVPSSL